jgi:DNA-directed RNA polymerase subunit RPC12/RpoP
MKMTMTTFCSNCNQTTSTVIDYEATQVNSNNNNNNERVRCHRCGYSVANITYTMEEQEAEEKGEEVNV